MNNANYYGLLYVDSENRKTNPNTRKSLFGQDLRDPIETYILNAVTCANSAKHFGIPFKLITNDANLVRAKLNQLGFEQLDVVGYEFKKEIPKRIPFYAAHYKIELLESFGRREWGPFVGLVDIDTVFLSPPPALEANIKELKVYDVSSQMYQAYGCERMQQDLCILSGRELANPAWFGGEAIAGSAEAFNSLSEYFNDIWPLYLKSLASCTHVGDETVVSTALNMASADGMVLNDWGSRNAVLRWFTSSTLHEQLPFEEVVRECTLLHLLTDKEYLADYAGRTFAPESFVTDYRAYMHRKLLPRRIYSSIANILRQRKRYIARIA